MSISNHERVGKALELLKLGLGPFVEREFKSVFGSQARNRAADYLGEDRILADKPVIQWDVAALQRVMWEAWGEVFKRTLGQSDRTLISELRDVRNKWAHQQNFSSDDAYRALDSIGRLLTAVSAPEAQEVDKSKMELLRVRFDEQVRTEKRKSTGPIENQGSGTLKPWREVVAPHKDVASGRYQQAEFAADLWQVHLDEGSDEYRKPAEFFRRTYLTESLKRLLVGAAQRLNNKGGDPVVQLQTNFGGGKTHSMLALYHLFSGVKSSELVGAESVLKDAGVATAPKANRAVLVGNKISPGNPIKKSDGTIVRTLWGELAWQLGGKKAFERVRADDEKATNPGDALRELFNEYSPCLILIDEWVAYARQLHDQSDLPAGSFETQFSFAQALTESAKLAKGCLLVISLPASDTSGSPHTHSDDVEVGGQRGREALDRLRNVIGRVDSSWRPASAEEGFEIVRRRLFEPLIQPNQFVARDLVAREFYDLYRTQQQEFPPECRDTDYERRLKDAYPIHPEVFDRLYTDWSTLVKFQRTRGVLRLMAAVIHGLWEKGDRNPLIMPANIPIDEPQVQFELTRYLSDNWIPVIEKDVDGPNSLPLRLDGEVPNLGKFSACRRVARAIYLGSAPTSNAANRGVEDRRIKLGCVMPGESPAVFGDALRRLAAAATYLYPDGNRYWYSTQPTVTKLADDRAEQLKREPDKIIAEVEKRLRTDLKKNGDFGRIHTLPKTNADVADDMEARLVVLGIDHPYSKEVNNAAEAESKLILDSRGNSPRLYRNTLVFLAADKTRLQDLDEAVRRYLAWDSIVDEATGLDLSPNQVKQAEIQKNAADGAVVGRLPETYQWLLVPGQKNPQSPVEWQAIRLTGQEGLAVRASKKLKSDESLATTFAASRLRMELDKVPLWRGDSVSIKQLIEDFARYLYLQRLKSPAALTSTITNGLSLASWEKDSFGYAESYDGAEKRFRGLQTGKHIPVSEGDPVGILVKSEAVVRQREAERAAEQAKAQVHANTTADGASSNTTTSTNQGANPEPTNAGLSSISNPPSPQPTTQAKRFYGSVTLDPARVGRDASRIAEEVITHLAGLVGAKVTVTLEIEAELPNGVPDNVVRTVTENSRTLKFTTQGFEDK
jgi:predicted AAA+ superfamily ATPase